MSSYHWGVVSLLLLLLPACQPEADKPAGKIHANPAFIQAFGQPSQPKVGEAWALVGYYPDSRATERLRPVPFFLFNEKGQLRLVLSRLVAPLVSFRHRTGLQNPFPKGAELVYANPVAGVLQTDLRLPVGSKPSKAMLTAVAETALQFPEVDAVLMSVGGESPVGWEEPYRHRPQVIAEPGPPQLLLLVGHGEEPGRTEEVLVNFDRPVTVDQIALFTATGEPLTGDYFQSVFEMAVVFRPPSGQALRDGMQLQVRWRVHDRKGRAGQGEELLDLQVEPE